jgi:microcystin-dependent protein
MSGTIPLSMTQQMDQYGDPLSGGKLYFFVAGTVSTPQNAFQDGALALPWPNPITLDATGRVPQLFLADGLIKIRLTDKDGSTQLVADNIQVIGPSTGGGGGGGATVDPTTVYQTGDLKPRYGVGIHTGWVRLNGLTIGDGSSGATESHDSSTQALFQYLWNLDAALVVVGGRGVSSLADWTGHKQLTLPDFRGYVIAGLDDMGSTPAGRLTAAGFGVAATTLGIVGGAETHILTKSELPVTAPTFTGTQQTWPIDQVRALVKSGVQGAAGVTGHFLGDESPITTQITPAGTISAIGDGSAHTNVQATKCVTIYMKL